MIFSKHSLNIKIINRLFYLCHNESDICDIYILITDSSIAWIGRTEKPTLRDVILRSRSSKFFSSPAVKIKDATHTRSGKYKDYDSAGLPVSDALCPHPDYGYLPAGLP